MKSKQNVIANELPANTSTPEREAAYALAVSELDKCKTAQDVFNWMNQHKTACGTRNLGKLLAERAK